MAATTRDGGILGQDGLRGRGRGRGCAAAAWRWWPRPWPATDPVAVAATAAGLHAVDDDGDAARAGRPVAEGRGTGASVPRAVRLTPVRAQRRIRLRADVATEVPRPKNTVSPRSFSSSLTSCKFRSCSCPKMLIAPTQSFHWTSPLDLVAEPLLINDNPQARVQNGIKSRMCGLREERGRRGESENVYGVQIGEIL